MSETEEEKYWPNGCWRDTICAEPDPTTRIDPDALGSPTSTIMCKITFAGSYDESEESGGRATTNGIGRQKCSCVICPELRRKSYI